MGDIVKKTEGLFDRFKVLEKFTENYLVMLLCECSTYTRHKDLKIKSIGYDFY